MILVIILCFQFVIVSPLLATNNYHNDHELDLLIKEQRLLHSEDIQEKYYAVLNKCNKDIKSTRLGPAKLYLGYYVNPENDDWLRDFISLLKGDLKKLGVSLKTHASPCIKKRCNNINKLKDAEKYVFFGTKHSPFFKGEEGYAEFDREWGILKSTFNVDYNTTVFHGGPGLEKPCILPIRVDGSAPIYPYDVKELYSDYFIEDIRITRFDYVGLLMYIAEFAYKKPLSVNEGPSSPEDAKDFN